FRASGAEQRLRNLGVPESHIREVRAGKMPLTLDWPAPATGDVIENDPDRRPFPSLGHRRHSRTRSARYQDGHARHGDGSCLHGQPIQGEVTFIYPELRAETRTARVRIEVPNPDG